MTILPSFVEALRCDHYLVTYEVALQLERLVVKKGDTLRAPGCDCALDLVEALMESIAEHCPADHQASWLYTALRTPFRLPSITTNLHTYLNPSSGRGLRAPPQHHIDIRVALFGEKVPRQPAEALPPHRQVLPLPPRRVRHPAARVPRQGPLPDQDGLDIGPARPHGQILQVD